MEPDKKALAHELVHARDYSEGWLVRGDCRSNVCSELKAYKATLDEYQSAFPPDILKDMLTGQAANSAMGNCGNNWDKAKKLAEEVYDECVGKGDVF